MQLQQQQQQMEAYQWRHQQVLEERRTENQRLREIVTSLGGTGSGVQQAAQPATTQPATLQGASQAIQPMLQPAQPPFQQALFQLPFQTQQAVLPQPFAQQPPFQLPFQQQPMLPTPAQPPPLHPTAPTSAAPSVFSPQVLPLGGGLMTQPAGVTAGVDSSLSSLPFSSAVAQPHPSQVAGSPVAPQAAHADPQQLTQPHSQPPPPHFAQPQFGSGFVAYRRQPNG